MSTPVSVREREEAIERAAKRAKARDAARALPSSPQLLPLSSNPVGWSPLGTRRASAPKKFSGPRYPRQALVPPKVEEITKDVVTMDCVVDADTAICFSSKGPYDFLSTFYAASMEVEGNEYSSVEHYFQACMLYTLAGPKYASVVRSCEGTKVKGEARRMLADSGVPRKKVDEWMRSLGLVLLQYALTHKFVRSPKLREKLLETGDALLVQAYDRENVYASGCSEAATLKWIADHNGETIKVPAKIDENTLPYVPLVGAGKNVLGFMMMKLRKDLRGLVEEHSETNYEKLITLVQQLHLKSGLDMGDK